MADVRPFRGVRFAPSVAPDLGLVLCPPYDVIDATDDARLRARHPNNVVRLELTTASVAGGPDERYQQAADTLRSWQQDGALVQDDAPAYYLHEATFANPAAGGAPATRRELIAAVGLEPWDRRVVLPHEQTYPRAKADRLRLLAATETNLSPILVFFQREGQPDAQRAGHQAGPRDGAGPAGVRADSASAAQTPAARTIPDAVDAAWAWTSAREPDAAGTDADGVGHRLWVLTDAALSDGLRAYFADRPLFIADGHHRYETALNHLEDRQQQAGGDLPADHPARFVMMHLIAEDDPGLVILPLHRLVTGTTTMDFWGLVGALADEFEVSLRDGFDGEGVDAVLAELHERGERGQAIALFLSDDSELVLLIRAADAPFPSAIPADRDDAWRSLDVVLVDFMIIRPLLAALSLHAEDAISYTRDAHEAIAQVRQTRADIAVLVNATRPEQVAAVALAGERMPEKSTYFYPKAPTGLVFRLLT